MLPVSVAIRRLTRNHLSHRAVSHLGTALEKKRWFYSVMLVTAQHSQARELSHTDAQW